MINDTTGSFQPPKEDIVSNVVKPELPSGFKDYTPSEVLARNEMIKKIERVYRRFGFVPLETSIGQRRLTLTGGSPATMRMWDMRVDTSNITTDEAQRVTARFDLTVPLARFVAANMGEIRFPFRRYEIGDVFRGESPQVGRYCQFKQFDADIVGAPTGPADAEMILCMASVMSELGINRFLIKINNRKILNGFAEKIGLTPGSEKATSLMRVMDKADKIGIDGVLAELAGKTEGSEETCILEESDRQAVHEFMMLVDGIQENTKRLAKLKEFLSTESGQTGVIELEKIAELLQAGGIRENQWAIDPSIARGLGYYTGPVFETILLDKPEIGSIYSGGRFDDLVARFTGNSLPSVGASVGVDRLFAALKQLNVVELQSSEVDVFIICMQPKFLSDYFAIASKIRAAGISAEIGMSHQDMTTKAQMNIALTRRAPCMLFYGETEKTTGTIQIKTTVNKKQKAVSLSELIPTLKEILQK